MAQSARVVPFGYGLNISCQDVNFREIQDMKRRSKHFMLCPDSTSIADSQTCEVVESHRISTDRPPINVPSLELEFYPSYEDFN